MPKDLKHHQLIVGLLITILILSLIAVALIVNIISKGPKNAIVDICGEEVTTAVQQRANELTAACASQLAIAKNENAAPLAVAPSALHPGFSYPATWSASGTEIIGEPEADTLFLFRMDLGPGPLITYTPSEETNIPINIQTFRTSSLDLGGAISYEAYLYKEYEGIQDLVITSEKKGKGILYSISGAYVEGIASGPFESIQYVTDAHVSALYFGPGMWEEQRSGWEMIKSTLDFSMIE